MKFTIGWLKEHLDTQFKDNEILEKLTDVGLEVESFENVISESYGDSEVPVRYDRVLNSDDFLDKGNMGDVEKDSGCGKENETWKNAPLITVKGAKIRPFDPVKDSMERAT